ncbi:DASH complex subunit Dad4p [Monosporozyma unispora]
MENPYESTQRNILSRIINNMTRLNQSVVTMNQELKIINAKNQQLCTVATICDNYQESVQFNLTTTDQLKPAANK